MQSLVTGSLSPPLSTQTVSAFFAECVSRQPSALAVVFAEQQIRWTWQEFADHVDKLASGLLRLGIAVGDRVGIWSPNRAEWLLTQFATARIGAILVNINPAYRTHELEHALNKVQVKLLICADRFKTSNYIDMLQIIAPEQIGRASCRKEC